MLSADAIALPKFPVTYPRRFTSTNCLVLFTLTAMPIDSALLTVSAFASVMPPDAMSCLMTIPKVRPMAAIFVTESNLFTTEELMRRDDPSLNMLMLENVVPAENIVSTSTVFPSYVVTINFEDGLPSLPSENTNRLLFE